MHHALVVEDNGDVSEVVKTALEDAGECRVSCVTAAVDAIQTIALDRPDIAIIDLLLPDLPGIDLANYAMSEGVPVLLTTGAAELEPNLRAAGLRCLLKPFRLETLLAETRQLLRDRGAALAEVRRSFAALQRNRGELAAVFGTKSTALVGAGAPPWRARAAEARNVAELIADPDARLAMLTIVERYEALAQRIEKAALKEGR